MVLMMPIAVMPEVCCDGLDPQATGAVAALSLTSALKAGKDAMKVCHTK